MERRGPALTAFRPAGWPGGSGTGGAPTAEAERLCWWTASHYFRALARARVHVVSECVPTRSVLSTSPSLAGWLGDGGERWTCSVRLAGRTAAAAGFGVFCGNLINALLRRCL